MEAFLRCGHVAQSLLLNCNGLSVRCMQSVSERWHFLLRNEGVCQIGLQGKETHCCFNEQCATALEVVSMKMVRNLLNVRLLSNQ